MDEQEVSPEHDMKPTKVEFKVPEKWIIYNNLYNVNISEVISFEGKNSSKMVYFDEDIVQISTPHGMTIDVGWHPACSPKGKFICVIIKNKDWDHPTDEQHFKTWQEVRDWVNKWIEKLNKVCDKK